MRLSRCNGEGFGKKSWWYPVTSVVPEYHTAPEVSFALVGISGQPIQDVPVAGRVLLDFLGPETAGGRAKRSPMMP